MKIAIFGNFGVDNRGDDLILAGLREQFPEDELMLFCGNPEYAQEQYHLPAFSFFPGGLRSHVKSWISPTSKSSLKQSREALQRADLILIGGGGILVDRHLKALFLWHAQLKQIMASGKPYRFIANSFELTKPRWIALFLPALQAAESISVRDKASRDFIRSLGLVATLVPDLAYSAPLPEVKPSQKKQIGVALCRWGLDLAKKNALQSFLLQKQSEGYALKLMAFQSRGDDDRNLYQELLPGIPVVTEWSGILQEMASCEGLLGMRLHSLILADRLQIPFVGIAYQDKVQHFMEDLGKKDLLLTMDELDEQKLQQLFEKAVASGQKAP